MDVVILVYSQKDIISKVYKLSPYENETHGKGQFDFLKLMFCCGTSAKMNKQCNISNLQCILVWHLKLLLFLVRLFYKYGFCAFLKELCCMDEDEQ